VRKRAIDIQAFRQVWIAEVNQADKRYWDFRSCSQLLRPPHLFDGILGDEFVPDEAVYLPRARCSEIVIEKISPRQRGVIADKSFKSRVFPCKNTVPVGSAVVEMRVCIDDCCPAGERGTYHSTRPGRCKLRRRAGMRLRSQRPHRSAAEQRDELAPSKPIELHPLRPAREPGQHNDWRASSQALAALRDFGRANDRYTPQVSQGSRR